MLQALNSQPLSDATNNRKEMLRKIAKHPENCLLLIEKQTVIGFIESFKLSDGFQLKCCCCSCCCCFVAVCSSCQWCCRCCNCNEQTASTSQNLLPYCHMQFLIQCHHYLTQSLNHCSAQ